MTYDDHLFAQLRNLDQPVEPDRDFARSLGRQFMTETDPAQSARAPVAIQTGRYRKTTTSGATGKHMLDLAAVAVLLLGMIGGLAQSTTTGGDLGTQLIEAPNTSRPPVMFGGSAARDRQLSGPAPLADRYELAWELTPESGKVGSSLAFGSMLYVLDYERAGATVSTVTAYDLGSGNAVWVRPITFSIWFAVTERGVVAGVVPEEVSARPETFGTTPFNVALLDLTTGNEIWRTDLAWGTWSNMATTPVLVSRDKVWFTDGLGNVVALDLISGSVDWTYTYERVPGAGLDTDYCFPGFSTLVPNCYDRFGYHVSLVVFGDSVYVADQVTGKVSALEIADGSVRWSVEVAGRSPERTFISSIVALTDGVAVMLEGEPETGVNVTRYLGVWDTRVGAELWSEPDVYAPWMVSDGELLLVQRLATDEETTCCILRAFDPETGNIKWSGTHDGSNLAGYLTVTNQILFNEFSPLAADIGINGETFAEDWYFRYFQDDCAPIYPLPDNGYVVCHSLNYGLRVLRPVNESEASPVASPDPGG